MKRILFVMMAVVCGVCAYSQSKVVAHRGYWKTEGSDQNSIRALVKADSIGCWGSEFDVWMTADGKLVVNHDATIDGVVIEKSTAKEVLAKTLANGEHVPTLEAYLKKFSELPNIKVVCELKRHSDKKHEAKAVKDIVKMVRKYGLSDRVTYITFSKQATLGFVKHAPKGTEVYYLSGDWTPEQLKAAGCAGLDYSLGTMRKHPEWIGECHRLGMKVNIWTVNKQEDLQWCIDGGADFITTNEPELLQQLLAK